jgi:hypothetical protein
LRLWKVTKKLGFGSLSSKIAKNSHYDNCQSRG